ncbi:MAG: multiheme c-type cytochrome [Verrucomicrobiota bacterium]
MKFPSRRTSAIIAVFAALLVAAYFIINHKKTESDAISIYFTCDTSGRLEPCGCFTGQHGGLTRLKTWFDAHPPRGDSLKADVGGALAGGADYDVIQYRYLLRAFAAMEYAALNMGASEAALPAETLRDLAKHSPVPMISASLVDAASRKAVLPPTRIVTIAGKRIGILGIAAPESIKEVGRGLSVLTTDEAVSRHLPELERTTDFIILLAFAKEDELRRLARTFYEIDVILGGDVAGPAQEIIRENESIILYTTNEARTVGTLSGKFSPGKPTRLVDAAYNIEMLWENIPQADEFRTLVRAYRDEIRRTPLAIDAAVADDPNAIPGVAPMAMFIGSSSCASCHQSDHAKWAASGHAHAFETLVKKGSDADPHCIKCHTVGFGEPGGYRRSMGAGKFVDVGCESCHGPASAHLDKVLHGKPVNFTFRPLGPADCKSCHYGEFSRPFDWNEFWPPVAHGKEGAAPRKADRPAQSIR